MSENVKVVVRFRPFNKKEKDSDSKAINIDTTRGVIDIVVPPDKNHQFIFDNVFDGNTTQEIVFNSVAKNAVEWVVEGYNSTIFSYGNTGSGKSFTMFGHENGSKELRGIIPRACDSLFENMKKRQDVLEYSIKCSFLEIYREHIRDLLSQEAEYKDLKIRVDSFKGIYVQSLIEKQVFSPQEILNIIKEGATQRVTASTSLNSVSSRSHAVLTLTVIQKIADGSEILSKLHLIDLAGSENVGKSEAQGITLIEAQMINKSLCALGNVIFALTEKGRDHIPYRDSKLTYMLQDSLGGNSKTILIATASPSFLSYSETVNTFKFAQRAKLIKNAPKVNKQVSNPNLQKTIDSLNTRILELEKELEKEKEDAKHVLQAIETTNKENKELKFFKSKCERLLDRLEKLKMESENLKNQKIEDAEMFEKQRELSETASLALMTQTINNAKLNRELDQYKSIYESLKDSKDNPSLLSIIMNSSRILN